MQDQPEPADILDLAVAHLRERVLPKLEAQDQFELRVTIAALGIVRRHLALAAGSDAAEQERLAALLGEVGGLDALNRRLCAQIRDGAVSLQTPGLARHLRATAMEKLAVDQPAYPAYQRALKD